MTFPLPPADSLYKFVTFLSLLVVVSPHCFAWRCYNEAEEQSLGFQELHGRLSTSYDLWRGQFVQLDSRYFDHKRRFQELDAQIDAARKLGPLSQDQEEEFRQRATALDDLKVKLDESFKEHMEVAIATDNLKTAALVQEIRCQNANLWLSRSLCFCLAGLVLGLPGMIGGMYFWFIREQRFKDSQLKKDSTKSDSPANVHKKRKGRSR